jgi:hypothetical protein
MACSPYVKIYKEGLCLSNGADDDDDDDDDDEMYFVFKSKFKVNRINLAIFYNLIRY